MDKHINKEIFAERLLELMNENDDTTYSLGEYLFLSPSAISRYTTGDSQPKMPILDTIARKYKVNPDWLMGIENAEKYYAGMAMHIDEILNEISKNKKLKRIDKRILRITDQFMQTMSKQQASMFLEYESLESQYCYEMANLIYLEKSC